MNQDHDIMGQNLEEHFVDLSDRGFRPDRRAKLCLNHVEGRLDVGPLVVVFKEFPAVQVEVVKGPLPQAVPLVVGDGLVPFASRVWHI